MSIHSVHQHKFHQSYKQTNSYFKHVLEPLALRSYLALGSEGRENALRLRRERHWEGLTMSRDFPEGVGVNAGADQNHMLLLQSAVLTHGTLMDGNC